MKRLVILAVALSGLASAAHAEGRTERVAFRYSTFGECVAEYHRLEGDVWKDEQTGGNTSRKDPLVAREYHCVQLDGYWYLVPLGG